MTEFKIDGFVTNKLENIIYHSLEGVKFDNQLKSIFNEELSLEGLSYILMANDMIHSVKPNAIIIATDNSHYPFLARPIRDGGLGFDYQTEPDHISDKPDLLDKFLHYSKYTDNDKYISCVLGISGLIAKNKLDIKNLATIVPVKLGRFLSYTFGSSIGYLVLSLEGSKAAQNLDSIVLKNDFYQKILRL